MSKLKKITLFLISVITILGVGFGLILVYIAMQVPSRLFLPERSYNVIPPFDYEQEFVQSGENRLDAWWFENPTSSEVILFFHGNSGRVLEFFPNLTARYNVLSVAYPGYHHSEGEPNKENVYQSALDSYQYLLDEKDFSENEIIIYGHSMGGAPATYLAAEKPQAQKLILANTFSSVKSVCQDDLGLLCILVFDQFNSMEYAKKVTIPVKQYHLVSDKSVDFEQGQELYENFTATEDKQFEELTYGVHSYFDYNQTIND